jgi:hypothetical protein
MTIEELNALYEATDFGNQGNYKAPTTSNINLTAPVVEGIPAIQPYMAPFIQNQNNDGADNFPGPPTDPMSFGQNNIPGYNQLNIAGPVKGQGIQGLIDLYQKFSPMANIMKLGKTGIETAQKYFADKKETERLEALAQIEQARKQKEAQATIAAAEEKSKQIAANRIQAANEQNRTGGYQAGYGSDFMGGGDRGTGMGAADKGGSDSMGSFARGGRTGYGTGGIVTL